MFTWLNKACAALAAAACLSLPLAACAAPSNAPGSAEAAPAAAALSCSRERAIFTDAEGRSLSFRVEIADTPESRAQGLMFRRSLPEGEGMLFIYERPQPVSFWMRNTLIPLDLIFMDARGEVRHVHHRAIPLDETPIPGAAAGDPDPNRLMVLEIAGGEARRLGLAPGAVLSHPDLDQNAARSPCH